MLSKRKPKNRPKNPHWRAQKRYILKLADELERKGYFEDCNYAPCKVSEVYRCRATRMGIYSFSVDGEDLLKNKGSSCSLTHCNALPLTEKEAFERRDFWREHGEVAYQQKYVYVDATLKEVENYHMSFIKEWRPEEYKAYVPKYQ